MDKARAKHMQIAKSRLDWARKRIDEFIAECDAFLAKEPYAIIPEVQTKGGNRVRVDLQIQVRVKPLRILRFRAGDAIHNLRAVADNLIWAIGQTRGASDRLALQFCKTNDIFVKDYLPKIECLPVEIRDWILSEQPYCRPNNWSILNVLNLLWNADKHKAPTLLAAALPSATLIASKDSLYLEIVRSRGLNDGDKIGTAIIPINQKMDFNADFTFDIAFSQKSPAQGAIVKTWLVDAHKHIAEEVIPKFEPFLR